MSQKAYPRKQGIKAIIDLQAMAGITEPIEKATKEWDNFTKEDKLQTTLAHKTLCGIKETKCKPTK